MTLQMVKVRELNTTAVPDNHGLAAWILALLRDGSGQRQAQRRQLQVVETLQLGGKKQLMLVSCAGENFLVGAGVDSVETIVRVRSERSADAAEKTEQCR